MSITLTDISDNLKNNKVFSEPKVIVLHHVIHPSIDNVFHDINLKSLLYGKKNTLNNMNIMNNNNNNNNNTKHDTKQIKTLNKKEVQKKFKINSFITELTYCLYLRGLIDNDDLKSFKDTILNFINEPKNKDFLLSISRSYKKLQSLINTQLYVYNTDEIISDELIKIICNVFKINIIFISNNIYKIFGNFGSIYLLFDKYDVLDKNNDSKKVYKFNKDIDDINLIKNNHLLFYYEKDLKKMKIDDIRNIQNTFKISQQYKTKNEIINKILETCSLFL